eukprot:CAMPEP_0170089514 /NCGR_PEP_ID=MMETSP0019_2-20121128/23561_1 /TAXON_ID=98059 /ORGANISM="Dinobryon sp., Strain UTEXLB2267" /LENGTH=35 /DNA_ID= /DNA_START= /DNA_END= /DNA_ORIENTATION=
MTNMDTIYNSNFMTNPHIMTNGDCLIFMKSTWMKS